MILALKGSQSNPEVKDDTLFLMSTLKFGCEFNPQRANHRMTVDCDAVNLTSQLPCGCGHLTADETGTKHDYLCTRSQGCSQSECVIKGSDDMTSSGGRCRRTRDGQASSTDPGGCHKRVVGNGLTRRESDGVSVQVCPSDRITESPLQVRGSAAHAEGELLMGDLPVESLFRQRGSIVGSVFFISEDENLTLEPVGAQRLSSSQSAEAGTSDENSLGCHRLALDGDGLHGADVRGILDRGTQ